MTPQNIIDMATSRTGKRGTNVLNLPMELLTVIQDLCGLAKWDWRKTVIDIPAVATQAIYNLAATTPSAGDLESIELLQWVSATGVVSRIDPVLVPADQAALRSNTEQGVPNKYFRQGVETYKILINPAASSDVATGAFLRLTYWATPASIPDLNGTVPVVPFYLYRALVKGMEKQILRYTVGQTDANYQLAAQEYADMVKTA